MHLFIKCKAVKTFWIKIENIFRLIGINHNVKKLKNIIIGYKINSVEYYPINNVFALIAFVIYKAYYVSECRTIEIDIFNIFKQELKTMILSTQMRNKVCDKIIKQIEQNI